MSAPAAVALRPAARPGLRSCAQPTRAERRLGRRLAGGLTPAEAARAEGLPAAEVERLLQDSAFAELVEAYRDLAARPACELRARLIGLARALLEEAVVGGDVQAGLFVLREEARGRDPAETLADGVIASVRRPSAPHRPPAAPSPARQTPAHPADRAAWRTAARLRAALVREHVLIRTITQAQPAATVSRAAAPTPNRRGRRRLAALQRNSTPPVPRSRSP